jgi:hypothetical protein
VKEIHITEVNNGWYVTITSPSAAGQSPVTYTHLVFNSTDTLLAALPELLGKPVVSIVEAPTAFAPTPQTGTVTMAPLPTT